jgi:hypothetical protein
MSEFPDMTNDDAITMAGMLTNPFGMAMLAQDLMGYENFLAALMLILNDAVQGTCSCDVCQGFREVFQNAGTML